MTSLEHHEIGAVTLGPSATRRDTAAAGAIPAGITATTRVGDTDAHIPGHLPAHARTATSTREHHCGGSPIHDVPARRHPRIRPPPPRHGELRSSRHPAVKVVPPRCAAG